MVRNIEASKNIFICVPHDNIRLVKVFGLNLDIRTIRRLEEVYYLIKPLFQFIFIQIIFFPVLDVIMVRNGINV